ncbi:hypothetical protein MTO96_045576, partial [Rhipicephalus appendiculatus]
MVLEAGGQQAAARMVKRKSMRRTSNITRGGRWGGTAQDSECDEMACADTDDAKVVDGVNGSAGAEDEKPVEESSDNQA